MINKTKKTKVVVGLSGGVDSAVTAYLLKEQGYDVTGIYMVNWHDTTGVIEGSCPGDDDVLIAKLIARKLDIKFEVVDFSQVYKKRVVDYMFSEYEKGRTPNPDVLCNREVKFDVFLDKALETGAEFVATGHYCRKETVLINGKPTHRLLAGKDNGKDQSYFLCQLSQKQLEKALFPIGELQKSEVRDIAREQKLAAAEKKDSQGICFVGKVDLPEFLQQKLTAKEGDMILIPKELPEFRKFEHSEDLVTLSSTYNFSYENGKKIGTHKGAHFYTVGQRRGLGAGGLKEPGFVIATNVKKNIIYIGEGKQHPGLFRPGLFINKDELKWVRPDLALKNGESQKLNVRIRYRQSLQKAEIFLKEEGLYIVFDEPQRGITPGQFAALYVEDELIGSGVINA